MWHREIFVSNPEVNHNGNLALINEALGGGIEILRHLASSLSWRRRKIPMRGRRELISQAIIIIIMRRADSVMRRGGVVARGEAHQTAA